MADEETTPQQENNSLNIELSEEVAEGTYTNLAIISHSNAEFILDFIRVLPGIPKARVKSRLIMTPQHAKRLHNALADNIEKYENANGEIELGEQENMANMPMNFGGPQGIA